MKEFMIRSKWGNDNSFDTFYIIAPIGRQKMYMGLECCTFETLADTIWWNIVVSVYTKRKHATADLSNKRSTGESPLLELVYGRQMLAQLEQHVITSWYRKKDNIFFCEWTDNRRRDVYYKVLHKLGYDWGKDPWNNEKCLMKRIKAQEAGY